MATIAELREIFDGMPTAQKKQFVLGLKARYEDSDNKKHKQFVNECIEKYNAEVSAGSQQYGGLQYGSQQYGNQQYAGMQYGGQRAAGPYRGRGSFAEAFRCYGGSSLFFAGIILFTAGNLAGQYLSFSFLSVVTLIPLALPIVGFWLLYAASKSMGAPGKALAGLTLIKISVIISLVEMCFIPLGILAVAVLIITGGGLLGFGGAMVTGIAMLPVAAGSAAVIIIYYRAVLRIIGGIRAGLSQGIMQPLRGVKVFTVFTFIFISFAILFALISFLVLSVLGGLVGDFMYYVPSEYSFVLDMLLPSAATAGLSALCAAAVNVGKILCVVSLNRFNNNLINRAR